MILKFAIRTELKPLSFRSYKYSLNRRFPLRSTNSFSKYFSTSQSINMPRVFLITGCSTGFGKDYVQEVLDKGDYVVATARNTKDLSFKGTNDKNYLGTSLDVTKQDSIKAAFDAALKKFGRIDVVCNNAGYGKSPTHHSFPLFP